MLRSLEVQRYTVSTCPMDSLRYDGWQKVRGTIGGSHKSIIGNLSSGSCSKLRHNSSIFVGIQIRVFAEVLDPLVWLLLLYRFVMTRTIIAINSSRCSGCKISVVGYHIPTSVFEFDKAFFVQFVAKTSRVQSNKVFNGSIWTHIVPFLVEMFGAQNMYCPAVVQRKKS